MCMFRSFQDVDYLSKFHLLQACIFCFKTQLYTKVNIFSVLTKAWDEKLLLDPSSLFMYSLCERWNETSGNWKSTWYTFWCLIKVSNWSECRWCPNSQIKIIVKKKTFYFNTWVIDVASFVIGRVTISEIQLHTHPQLPLVENIANMIDS